MRLLNRWATVLVLALAVLGLQSCADVTAPPHPTPAVHAPVSPNLDVVAPNPDGTCRTGYSVATGRNGETICVKDDEAQSAVRSKLGMRRDSIVYVFRVASARRASTGRAGYNQQSG